MTEQRLRAKQAQALSALLAGKTVAIAAASAGISERQAYRWLRDKRFKSALVEQEALLLQSAGLRLAAMAEKACDVLEDVMMRPETRGANTARLAAVSALELLLKVRDAGVIDDRISALEELVKR
jgi:hypothetical protein